MVMNTIVHLHERKSFRYVALFFFLQQYSMFCKSLGTLTVICAIKEPRVMRHMNTEAALVTAVVRQRLAQHSGCNCHHSARLFYVAMGDGGV